MPIDWPSVGRTVLIAVGGTGVIVLAAVWIFKAAVNAWLARNIEAFKSQLRAEANIEVEKLKHLLQRAATEHQVMFSKMHDKRAEVIEELYKRLTSLHSRAEHFVLTSEGNPNPEHKQESDRLRKEVIEYFSFVQQHRIFLPTTLCELLNDHLVQIRKAVHIAGAYGGKEHFLTPQSADQSNEAFMKVYESFDVDIPAAQKL